MFTDEMTTAQRIVAAKATMTKVLDHFLYLLELHENNAIIVYSPHLSDQIPTSYAANAFNVFQSGMHRLAIIRLCALWDKAEREKECVPTVIKLIDNADVRGRRRRFYVTATHNSATSRRLLRSTN